MYSFSDADIHAMRLKHDRIAQWKRSIREVQFTAMVDELERRGLIKNVEHVGENAYGCTLSYASWAALARKAAGVTSLPGIVMPTRAGIVWVCGGGGPHGALIDNTLIDEEKPEKGTRLEGVIRARQAMAKTEYSGMVPWTLGGVGKRLLKYAAKPEAYRQTTEALTQDINQGYCIVKPGYYPSAELFDVSAYYFSMLLRIYENPKNSLRAIVTRSGVSFQKWGDGERERFGEVLAAVAGEKSLRNAMVGAAQGSLLWRNSYTSVGAEPGKARVLPMRGRPGPFRSTALLIVRSGYEITQKEALTSGAVYAMIDSVVLTQSARPQVWPGLGFTTERKAEGETEIYARGNYSCGPEKKALYRAGFRTTQPEAGNIIQPVSYYNKWL